MTSDEALYERLLGGDMTAFDALYERYDRPLFGFIRRYVGDPGAAEEVFHDAFIAVLRAGRRGAEVESFRPWIYRVARNLCLNRLRDSERSARAMAKMADDVEPSAESPEASLVRVEAEDALRHAVSRLPDHMSELYAMRATGMSYEGVAKVLDIPVGTVKSRIHAMLARLRKEMSS